MTKFPSRSPMTLPAILLLALLLPLAPLPACTEALAQMDSERSVKLDAPFLPTPNYVIAEILSKAGVGKDDILYDLGSGDGRIVIEAAKKTGCRAVGIEIDADLVDDSRLNAARAGVQDRVRFAVADVFREDISEATVVTIYMSGDVNRRLRPKLLRELKPGTRIARMEARRCNELRQGGCLFLGRARERLGQMDLDGGQRTRESPVGDGAEAGIPGVLGADQPERQAVSTSKREDQRR
jgi:precorrin-6B methylase 2